MKLILTIVLSLTSLVAEVTIIGKIEMYDRIKQSNYFFSSPLKLQAKEKDIYFDLGHGKNKCVWLNEIDRLKLVKTIEKYNEWRSIASNATEAVRKQISSATYFGNFQYYDKTKATRARVNYLFLFKKDNPTGVIYTSFVIETPEWRASDNEFMKSDKGHIQLGESGVNSLYLYLTKTYLEERNKLKKEKEDKKRVESIFK